MIETVPGYRVRCDGCNADAQADSDYACWLQPEGAINEVEDRDDWTITEDGRHWCDNCIFYDEELDAYVPKTPAQPTPSPGES